MIYSYDLQLTLYDDDEGVIEAVIPEWIYQYIDQVIEEGYDSRDNTYENE